MIVEQLERTSDRAVWGGKLSGLSVLRSLANVPAAVGIHPDAFEQAMPPEVRRDLAAYFGDVSATVGAFLLDRCTRAEQVVASVRMTNGQRGALASAMRSHFGPLWEEESFAVRSSARGEDDAGSSAAGVYRTVLGARGQQALYRAVEEVWHSYYSLPAVAHRVRRGHEGWRPEMAVVIQRQVEALMAGVAVSRGPDEPQIEFVRGIGEELVSGLATTSLPRDGGDLAVLEEVKTLVRRASSCFGGSIDLEWAWDGTTLFALQGRPVVGTTQRQGTVVDLYAGKLPPGTELGEVAEVYALYVQKRGAAFRAARRAGVRTSRGLVVSVPPGSEESAAGWVREALGTECRELIFDFGARLRQVIIGADEVDQALGQLARGGSTFIVREFLRGQGGFITTTVDNDVLVEFSAAGLLDMNRGLAAASSFVLTGDGNPAAGAAPLSGLAASIAGAGPRIVRWTAELDRLTPGAQLEWILIDDEPVFIDYSRQEKTVSLTGAGTCMSPGAATGPVVDVREAGMLERLSISPAISVGYQRDVAGSEALQDIWQRIRACASPPILVADRPFAVLSVFFGHVAGFVFRQGALLSHLGILLREEGIPAAIVADVDANQPRLTLADGFVAAGGAV